MNSRVFLLIITDRGCFLLSSRTSLQGAGRMTRADPHALPVQSPNNGVLTTAGSWFSIKLTKRPGDFSHKQGQSVLCNKNQSFSKRQRTSFIGLIVLPIIYFRNAS